MPINEQIKNYIGRNLFTVPYYGYGWNRQDSAAPTASQIDMLGPEPFHFRVDEFIFCDEQCAGVSGFIDQPEHPFNKYWCGCFLRTSEDADFTKNPGQYMVWIVRKKLSVCPSQKKALFEWVTPDKSEFCLCGYGAVAESAQWMQAIYDKATASRKSLVS